MKNTYEGIGLFGNNDMRRAPDTNTLISYNKNQCKKVILCNIILRHKMTLGALYWIA